MTAHRRVPAMKSRPHFKLPRRRFAQASTTVTLEAISTKVFTVASGTFRKVQPRGQVGAAVRSRINDENSAPNSITSDARKSQIPSLALYSPVSGRGWTLCGISSSCTAAWAWASIYASLCATAVAGNNPPDGGGAASASTTCCGRKSASAYSGLLYSYGPRCTTGSTAKFPWASGGEVVAAQSRVGACHGFGSAVLLPRIAADTL